MQQYYSCPKCEQKYTLNQKKIKGKYYRELSPSIEFQFGDSELISYPNPYNGTMITKAVLKSISIQCDCGFTGVVYPESKPKAPRSSRVEESIQQPIMEHKKSVQTKGDREDSEYWNGVFERIEQDPPQFNEEQKWDFSDLL